MFWKRSLTSRIGIANFGIAALRALSWAWTSPSAGQAAFMDSAASAAPTPKRELVLNIWTPDVAAGANGRRGPTPCAWADTVRDRGAMFEDLRPPIVALCQAEAT